MECPRRPKKIRTLFILYSHTLGLTVVDTTELIPGLVINFEFEHPVISIDEVAPNTQRC